MPELEDPIDQTNPDNIPGLVDPIAIQQLVNPINMQQIDEMIETNNYPEQLQYLNNRNYLNMYDNELQEYILNILHTKYIFMFS